MMHVRVMFGNLRGLFGTFIGMSGLPCHHGCGLGNLLGIWKGLQALSGRHVSCLFFAAPSVLPTGSFVCSRWKPNDWVTLPVFSGNSPQQQRDVLIF